MPESKSGQLPDTLEDWLTYLEALHPAEIELGLERVRTVFCRLKLPVLARQVVVVAGTNGKGSCVRTLEALALAHGYTAGSYTSPHILRYNERVRLGGQEVLDQQLCDAFARVEAERQDVPLTYFEMGTLAAMVIMAEVDLDFAFLEIGLGGRFDAVNIVDSDVAIITSIDLDHTDWLGNDRGSIALEKAGVSREGRPLVCADQAPPQSLVDHLKQMNVPALYLGQDFFGKVEAESLDIVLGKQSGPLKLEGLPVPSLPLPSVLAAMQALTVLGVVLEQSMVATALESISLSGRYQTGVVEGKRVILDVAHNPAAATLLAQRLSTEQGPLLCVAALMGDKDAAGFIEPLSKVVAHWFVGSLEGNKRAMTAEELADLLYTHSCSVSCGKTIEEAFDTALAMVANGGAVVVCGSFFTVAAVLKKMEKMNAL